MTGQWDSVRLLPWATPEGKPCFLAGDGRGYLSRVADNVESVQLGMGFDLLDHAADLLEKPKTSAVELRFLAARLTEALRDALRVAESRGARLSQPSDDPDVISPYGGDDDDVDFARIESRRD